MTLYVDGFAYPLGLDDTAFPGPTLAAHNLVGARRSSTGLSDWLKGEVDNVSIYEEALSERKIQAHLATSSAPAPEAILLPPDDENDSDEDGVADSYDNCPSVVNSNQVDSDMDGTGDACEVETEVEG